MCPQPFANVSTDAYGVWQPCCMTHFEERLSTDKDWEELLTKKDLKNVIVKVNNFFDEDWIKFKSSLETVNLSPFKKIETFELIE